MPTVPTHGVPDTERLDLHRAREMAESFGVDAEQYDAARPSYPDDLVQTITAGRPAPRILDIGCGTGIAARQLQSAGGDVVGIEPDERMAAFARSRGLSVEQGTFEAWDPRDRSFDIVTAAQSWHWVDPAIGPEKAAAILRPGGRLAIFGHVFEPPDDIARAFADAFRRVVPDSPFTASGRRPLQTYRAGYEHIATTLRTSGLFDDVDVWQFDWTRSYQRDEWLALLATTGGLTPLPVEARAEVLQAVGHAVDARGGSFAMEYVTLATAASLNSLRR